MEAVLNDLVSVEDLKVRPGPEGSKGESRREGASDSQAEAKSSPSLGFVEGSRTIAPDSFCGARLLPEGCALPRRLVGVVFLEPARLRPKAWSLMVKG
jgi:hypothetical protein